jgi:sugar (pentulose or hexulose) kinase
MRYYLGIDIGTFESKGVLVDSAGAIIASAAETSRRSGRVQSARACYRSTNRAHR